MTQLKKGPRRFARLGEVMNPSAPRASEPQARGLRQPQAKQRAQVPARPVTSAQARAHERDRLAKVFASAAVHGRETAAAYLLAHSDMTPEAILTTLSHVQATAAAKDEWRAKLKASAKPMIAASANHGWAKIHEKIRSGRETM